MNKYFTNNLTLFSTNRFFKDLDENVNNDQIYIAIE